MQRELALVTGQIGCEIAMVEGIGTNERQSGVDDRETGDDDDATLLLEGSCDGSELSVQIES